MTRRDCRLGPATDFSSRHPHADEDADQGAHEHRGTDGRCLPPIRHISERTACRGRPTRERLKECWLLPCAFVRWKTSRRSPDTQEFALTDEWRFPERREAPAWSIVNAAPAGGRFPQGLEAAVRSNLPAIRFPDQRDA